MTPKAARAAFIILFVILIAAFLYMAAPMMKAALLALIISVIFHPLYLMMRKWLRGYSYVASIVTTLLCFIIVLLPVVLVFISISAHITAFMGRLVEQVQGGQLEPLIDKATDILNGWLAYLPGSTLQPLDLRAELLDFLKSSASLVYQYSPRMLASTARLGINLIIMTIFLVVFFAEGSQLSAWLMRNLPLAERHKKEINKDIRTTISAYLLGMIATALAQGILIGLGFWVAGFENPEVWGLIAIVAAFIPIVGAASCYIGAVVVLFVMGRSDAALIFLVYGLAIVSSVDNVVRSLVMGERMKMHPVLLFVALLGGVRAFGPIGVVFGPVLLAVFLTSLRIYQREFASAG